MVIWSLVYFHSFEALNDAFEVQFFSGLHIYTLSKTLIACRAMQLRYLKVETRLNNAFNISPQTKHLETMVTLILQKLQKEERLKG